MRRVRSLGGLRLKAGDCVQKKTRRNGAEFLEWRRAPGVGGLATPCGQHGMGAVVAWRTSRFTYPHLGKTATHMEDDMGV